jgi:hypothetical protein
MPRQMIICPSCHRELHHLHRPQCSWCGAEMTEEEFEKVALPLGEAPTPDLPPLLPDNSWIDSSSGYRGWNFLSPQNYQFEMKFNQVALVICVLLISLAYFLWEKFQVHPLLPPLHHFR